MSILGKPKNWTSTLQDATVLVNQQPATGDAAMIFVKRAMNEAGYVTNRSSDGTTFSNTGDVIGTSALALGHTNAYFSLVSPDGKRWFIIRRGSTTRSWEFQVSVDGYNSDGTATTPPTAITGDNRYLMGNATTGGFNNFWAADNTYWFNMVWQTIAPYAVIMFTIFTNPSTTQAVQPEAGILIDPGLAFADSSDPDPCIYNWCGSGNTGEFLALTFASVNAGGLFNENVNNVGGGPRGWLGKNATNGAFAAIPPMTYNGSSGATYVYPSSSGINLSNLEDIPLPVPWERSPLVTVSPGAPYGYKGFSNALKYPGQGGVTGNPRDYTSPGSADGLIVNACIIPWPSALKLDRP